MVARQEKRFTAIYAELVGELKKNGIYIINETELTADQGFFVREFFNQR